ncbi:SCP-like protein [Oesophagostomum dentatum]|uniref:SCP-like protein n=1 Tax=Oesophagostomum dentatum TaxID=61180 RepID=A0A0B1TS24_OESDE|nr:SCP-like protein [Oesophagostomum dentatum]
MHVGRNCSSDDDCPHNPATQCISNRCIKLNQLCTSNADCPSLRGMVCSSGKCAYFGKTCTDDDECSNQMKCVINQCVRLGQPCSSDDDCPIPMTICTSSRCDKLTERTSAPYRAQTGVSTPLTATTFATTTEVPSVCRTTVEERNNILELHNTRRAMIAQGKMKKANGDGSYLPRASWMYMLKWDCRLENMAYEHATACSLKHSDPDTRVGIGEIFSSHLIDTLMDQILLDWLWRIGGQRRNITTYRICDMIMYSLRQNCTLRGVRQHGV